MTYNAVWFAIPILALVTCITRPEAARVAVASVEQWALEHSRAILLAREPQRDQCRPRP